MGQGRHVGAARRPRRRAAGGHRLRSGRAGRALAVGDRPGRRRRTETLDGVAVTHYVARFDLARLVRAEGAAPTREITEHLLGRLADPVAAVDLWVGDDGLPHRASVAAVTSDGPARVDLRLRDTGAAFAVVPPATGQMLDVTPLPGR